MATTNVCDATGVPVYEDAETFNEFFERVYSKEAAKDVRSYLEARDALQERLAEEWTTSLAELRDAFRAKHPNGKLPDEF